MCISKKTKVLLLLNMWYWVEEELEKSVPLSPHFVAAHNMGGVGCTENVFTIRPATSERRYFRFSKPKWPSTSQRVWPATMKHRVISCWSLRMVRYAQYEITVLLLFWPPQLVIRMDNTNFRFDKVKEWSNNHTGVFTMALGAVNVHHLRFIDEIVDLPCQSVSAGTKQLNFPRGLKINWASFPGLSAAIV